MADVEGPAGGLMGSQRGVDLVLILESGRREVGDGARSRGCGERVVDGIGMGRFWAWVLEGVGRRVCAGLGAGCSGLRLNVALCLEGRDKFLDDVDFKVVDYVWRPLAHLLRSFQEHGV